MSASGSSAGSSAIAMDAVAGGAATNVVTAPNAIDARR